MSKRTIENCSIIKQSIKEGLKRCSTFNGKCLGYEDGNEEVMLICQNCKLNVWYKDIQDNEMKDEYMRSGY